MMDPVTIGGLVASALAMTAETALKGAVGEAVKDGYKALREKLLPHATAEVASLEAKPGLESRQVVLAEIVNEQPEAEQEALRLLAQELIARVRNAAPVGADLGRLTDVQTELGKVTVRRGVGVRVHEAQGGTFKIGDLDVGGSSGN